MSLWKSALSTFYPVDRRFLHWSIRRSSTYAGGHHNHVDENPTPNPANLAEILPPVLAEFEVATIKPSPRLLPRRKASSSRLAASSPPM